MALPCPACLPQAEALTVDRSGFYKGLYAALLHSPLQPLDEDREAEGAEGEGEEGEGEAKEGRAGRKQQGSGGGGTANGVSASGQKAQQGAGAGAGVAQPAGSAAAVVGSEAAPAGVLLAQVLEAMVLDTKVLDALRQAAFAKRLCAAAAADGDSGAALGLLCVLHRMIRCARLAPGWTCGAPHSRMPMPPVSPTHLKALASGGACPSPASCGFCLPAQHALFALSCALPQP